MEQNFKAWLDFAWRPENDGQGPHLDPGDPGGETNYGVTAATWSTAVANGEVTGALTTASADDLTLILRHGYWHKCQCDSLPAGVDVMVADMAMVAGPGAAARCLQRTVNVADDGVIGPITLAAINSYPYYILSLISALQDADDTYYSELKQFRLWGGGWDRRASDCAKLAIKLAGISGVQNA